MTFKQFWKQKIIAIQVVSDDIKEYKRKTYLTLDTNFPDRWVAGTIT